MRAIAEKVKDAEQDRVLGMEADKIATTKKLEAIEAVEQCLNKNIFGKAGMKVIIEDFLEGEEASFIVLTDGETILPFASSQDHKPEMIKI